MPNTGRPSDKEVPMPRQMFMLPSVATNGLTRSHATARPLKAPTKAPRPRPTAVPASAAEMPPAPFGPTMPVMVMAAPTLIIDTLGPSDKSKPRVSRTMLWAPVSTNRNAVC